MPVTLPGTGPQPPDEPIAAVCAAMYAADLVPAYAFVFRVSTGTRFTVYARAEDRYFVGATYLLSLAEPDAVPLPLTLDDWRFLRHCLDNAAARWREAINGADAGAAQPQREQPAAPGCLNVEPTPAGYRAASRLFREELDRVDELNTRLASLVHAAEAARRDGNRS
jgi:hypothetical protein